MNNRIIYNVTVKIDGQIHEEWLQWMKEIHIPDVMKTGCFLSYRLTQIVEEPDEHGVGYAIQYVAKDKEQYDKYQNQFARALQDEHAKKYHGRYAAFRTLLEILAEE